MGNCQAVNAAVLVLQHPGGKIDRYYGSVSVSEVMAMYPGHYVSLIIPLTEEEERNIPATVKGDDKKQRKAVRFTRVQLLRPTENLVLGHAYRLITSQEVMKVLREKKSATTKKHQIETTTTLNKLSEKKVPEKKQGKQFRVITNSTSLLKSKTWRPSLQSISEATS
ncbi:unnamed protein product [Arabidopsis lyrata]|uniref:DUF4228 domain-containing protein n=1 Tax=Arabidopsis lyrata subsp. lyrata TaxID=81972 RepID=D7KKS4_ARALL|nr:uncharacterized protein LOC9325880 [Arabidopsis lyrata subsp. lyrata]EFH68834.1 hypothetical protein ARALYDRAFT_471168 [Arabidopsis lyrata subsp. lyrata]CAH8251826.1 unnamed protein product [Arabidopsis lyrata]|eukprot:XP_020868840.1 uncharacterized protein LOC9325880 [Arabidopsis lyrata subsp. lyrata]